MKVLHFVFGALLYVGAWAQERLTVDVPSADIPADETTAGYSVNNQELRFKDHVVLPRKKVLSGGGMIDTEHRLANLRADEQGNYWPDRILKIVTADNRTGEVKPTPYGGLIQCFVDGNLATLVNRGRIEDAVFSFGRYGETLQVWRGMVKPEGMYLNLMSCTLEPRTQLDVDLPKQRYRVAPLRPEHGQLLILSDDFLPSRNEHWALRKPNGDTVPIPKNQGEVTSQGAVHYLPYMGVYFIESRSMIHTEMVGVPQFARILYPDGRVVLYGVPDVIQRPTARGEMGYWGMYTKAGLVWYIRHARIDRVGRTNYKGELKEGFYLDRRETKTLVKIPDLSVTSQLGLLLSLGVPNDGCLVATREEIVQRQPHILFDIHYINLCTGK